MRKHRLTAALSAAIATDVALAPCAFALPKLTDAASIEIQLTPAGTFGPADGRELPVDAWRIDTALASQVIDRFRARGNPLVLDYEHQTLLAETNGQPAPAAGWIVDLVWHEGRGLYAVVELTQRARDLIGAGEYRYVSPVLSFDIESGEILEIHMAAITNNPALQGMEPLALRAAATFRTSPPTETPMNKLLLAVCAALALGDATTEDQAIAALTAAKTKLDGYDGLLKAAGIPADAKPEAAIAACTVLLERWHEVDETTRVVEGNPDPAKFVDIAVVESLKGEIAALTGKVQGREVDEAVQAGLADGRLLPAQEKWARELGAKDLAALTAYLETATPIAALNGTQTQGKPPEKDKDGNLVLTSEELAVCSATGIAPKDFAAAKAAQLAA